MNEYMNKNEVVFMSDLSQEKREREKKVSGWGLGGRGDGIKA